MKIYFSAARAYREKYGQDYQKIIQVLTKDGFQVTDNGRLKSPSGAFNHLSVSEKVQLYRGMLKKIDKADISVFEASFPSTVHIGHEISVALGKGKPVVVAYVEGREPLLFKGIQGSKIIWVEYSESSLTDKLTAAVELARKMIDVRFNFFVSPKILNYLDWVAQKRMIPRSVFLRNLIEKEMKKEKDFD